MRGKEMEDRNKIDLKVNEIIHVKSTQTMATVMKMETGGWIWTLNKG